MVGVEEYSIRGVKRAFEREGLPTPDGKRNWATPFIRGCISDDVDKPHTYNEVEPLVAAEVATRLDTEKRYGIWWFNRERVTYSQAAENDTNGKRHYRRRAKHAPKPRSEWVAVPVPDPWHTTRVGGCGPRGRSRQQTDLQERRSVLGTLGWYPPLCFLQVVHEHQYRQD
jgi:hypothetical protein